MASLVLLLCGAVCAPGTVPASPLFLPVSTTRPEPLRAWLPASAPCEQHGLERLQPAPGGSSGAANLPARRVFVGLLLAGELDLLEANLAELYDVVDGFVITEAAVTHRGLPKPLYFERHRARFQRFLHKIAHVALPAFPFDCSSPSDAASDGGAAAEVGADGGGGGGGAGSAGGFERAGPKLWGCEHFQRDAMLRGLEQLRPALRPTDALIFADADEILRASSVQVLTSAFSLFNLTHD